MGDERLEPQTVTQMLYSGFSQMLVCGMPSSEYWDGDALLAKCYMDAFRQRRENQWWRDWALGMYHRAAVASALGKDAEYPEEPFQVTAERERNAEATARKRESDGLAFFESFAIAKNASMSGKSKVGDGLAEGEVVS